MINSRLNWRLYEKARQGFKILKNSMEIVNDETCHKETVKRGLTADIDDIIRELNDLKASINR